MGWMMSCELVSTRMNKREVSMFRLPKGRTLRENLEGCQGLSWVGVRGVRKCGWRLLQGMTT